MAKKSVSGIIASGEHIMDASEEQFLRTMERVERELFAEIKKMLDTVSVTDGKLQTNAKAEEFLMSLDKRLRDAMRRSGYTDAVQKYVKSFDQINANVRDLHDAMNGINITAAQLQSAARLEVSAVFDKLTGGGLAKDFINPVRQSLYRNIMFGSTIGDAEKTIRDYVMSSANGDSKLLRYVKQAARDSVSQYDGALQQQISQELGLNGVRYVGSLIRDSRAQCIKWVEMGIIPYDQLQAEISWALRNGTYKGLRAGGMYPDTTVATFVIYRGGYNCRHRAIPTFIPGT